MAKHYGSGWSVMTSNVKRGTFWLSLRHDVNATRQGCEGCTLSIMGGWCAVFLFNPIPNDIKVGIPMPIFVGSPNLFVALNKSWIKLWRGGIIHLICTHARIYWLFCMYSLHFEFCLVSCLTPQRVTNSVLCCWSDNSSKELVKFCRGEGMSPDPYKAPFRPVCPATGRPTW